MVTIYDNKKVKKQDGTFKFLVELRGLSTDTKPTTIENGVIDNGSVFVEIDTQKLAFYDGANSVWKEVE